MIRPICATLLLASAATAHASDARLASRLYDPDKVVQLEGRAGVQATIAFAEDEHIENVAIGDSTSWQVTPNKRANLLFVKPLSPRARTNMTVVTDQRSYYFDLIATPTASAVYALRFTYPEKPKPVQPEPAQLAVTGEEAAAASGTPGLAPVDPATLHFGWRQRGASKLYPARIYDDGTATFLSWSASTPLPAILIRSGKGEEGPVNFAVRGDVIVVDGVPPLIVLRSGKDSATLERLPATSTPALASVPLATASLATEKDSK